MVEGGGEGVEDTGEGEEKGVGEEGMVKGGGGDEGVEQMKGGERGRVWRGRSEGEGRRGMMKRGGCGIEYRVRRRGDEGW